MRLKFAFMVMFVLLVCFGAAAQDDSPFVGNPDFPAPEFVTGLDWVNVRAPLTLAGLRGKVVLLDFWTYGCINCIHMVPVLKQLEEKYGDALAVIGVHSAKFANEGETGNLRSIVQRYGIDHPVINDNQFAIWQSYGVNAWPTFAVIDPRGNLFAIQGGEIPFEAFDEVIGGMIGYFDGLGEINREALPIEPLAETQPAGTLAYPGKLLVDTAGNRLFIADSSHNRIIITDLTTYEVLDVIGSGETGFDDGDFAAATFRKPQGMALAGSTLYVADTENHALRAVDLIERTVTTIAGTGRRGFNFGVAGPGLETDLASPWDLALGDHGILYIAMAGTHQIWMLTRDDGVVSPLVGSGREGLVEGGLGAAQLAQPSGLYLNGDLLYWADSESSSIRAANLASGQTELIAGPLTNDLFDFGDVDGGFGTARLQHPLAVVGGGNGKLYVADTYNSKIRVIDTVTKEVTTLSGSGENGFLDGSISEALFDEPGGLAFAGDKLYIADTNNSAVRIVDLAAQTVSTITFPNPEALQIGNRVTVIGGRRGEEITLQSQAVAAGSGEIVLNITLPEGYKLNPNIDLIAEWSAEGEALTIADSDRVISLSAPEMPLRVPVTMAEGEATLTGDLTIYYCEAVDESLCFIDQARVIVPVTVSAEGTAKITIERVIVPPEVPTGAGL